MDKREMKKELLVLAFKHFERTGSKLYELSLILDRDPTIAELKRFEKVLQQLVENARKKLK